MTTRSFAGYRRGPQRHNYLFYWRWHLFSGLSELIRGLDFVCPASMSSIYPIGLRGKSGDRKYPQPVLHLTQRYKRRKSCIGSSIANERTTRSQCLRQIIYELGAKTFHHHVCPGSSLVPSRSFLIFHDIAIYIFCRYLGIANNYPRYLPSSSTWSLSGQRVGDALPCNVCTTKVERA